MSLCFYAYILIFLKIFYVNQCVYLFLCPWNTLLYDYWNIISIHKILLKIIFKASTIYCYIIIYVYIYIYLRGLDIYGLSSKIDMFNRHPFWIDRHSLSWQETCEKLIQILICKSDYPDQDYSWYLKNNERHHFISNADKAF